MEIFNTFFGLLIVFAGFFLCLSVHEFAHAYVSNLLGDPTAKHDGRISLNPLAHIDIFGTVLLPLILIVSGLPAFGWAKPVYVNIYNFKNPALGNFLTAFAGPIANFSFAIIIALLISIFPQLSFLIILIQINVVLGIFNLIPIPPLDGSKIWHLVLSDEIYFTLERFGPFILIAVLLLSGGIGNSLFGIVNTVSYYIVNLF